MTSSSRPRPPARSWLRVLLPSLIVLAWLVAAGVGGPYFGRISEVASNDQASYLRASSEATQVSALLPEFAGGDDIPAIVVFARDGGLTDADREYAQSFTDSLATMEGIGDDVSPPIESEDGEAFEVFVAIS